MDTAIGKVLATNRGMPLYTFTNDNGGGMAMATPMSSCVDGCAATWPPLIALDDADVMLAGGAESAVCRIGMAGFAACRALSTNFNETPEKASRPYDKDRDGFVMAEGAAIVVLESEEFARARGAKIYAVYGGQGLAADAHHIAQPEPEGRGVILAINRALADADLSPKDVAHVNAHANEPLNAKHPRKNDQVERREGATGLLVCFEVRLFGFEFI